MRIYGNLDDVIAAFENQARVYRQEHRQRARLRKFRARMRNERPDVRIRFCAGRDKRGIWGC